MTPSNPHHTSAFLKSPPIPRRSKSNSLSACPLPTRDSKPTSQLLSDRSQRTLVAKVHLNDIIEGTVTRVTSFGAFVDIGNGQSGLVHISEIANCFVQDINEHVSSGDHVSVRVVSIDSVKNRIGLSIKQAVPVASGYQRVIELGGDWGHPWGDDSQTKLMDLGPRPEPRPHHWEPDLSLFEEWSINDDQE